MVAQRSRPHITVDEWRALEGSSEMKHEYIDGELYVMAGGSRAHSLIAVNVGSALSIAFGHGPCIAYNSDLATRLSPTRYTYPDVVVTCDERDAPYPDDTEISAPRIAFEVLSDSTEARDRGVKFSYYRDSPTLQEYVLIATNCQAVEVYRRSGEHWGTFETYGPGDTIELVSIQVRILMVTVYRRSGVPETLSGGEGVEPE